MSTEFWTFEDIANYSGYKVAYVRNHVMKEDKAPKPRIGRNRFSKAEVIRFLTIVRPNRK